MGMAQEDAMFYTVAVNDGWPRPAARAPAVAVARRPMYLGALASAQGGRLASAMRAV
eukprot:SAG11_NODE_21606_length_422_cov_0.547988_1_plen_57_part_00